MGARILPNDVHTHDIPDDETVPWFRYGLATGCLGAFVVAFYFLVLDLLQGHPLATPSALGAVLFTGRVVEPTAPVVPGLVLAYTMIHGTAFFAFGAMAAVATLSAKRLPGRLVLGMLLTGALFLAFEGVFFSIIALSGLVTGLQAGHITAANLLSAAAMATLLLRMTDHDA